ncbi:MAG: FmdB family transcriptional regulator [Actinomycetia bacterium]|nr:FmdB family transcriptional regulator [Actinomycetes bacterium]
MPTYQYACTDHDCAHRFEVAQSFTDLAVSRCPKCGHSVRKVYGSVGIVFKGSGFYRTDSRAEAKSSTAAKPDTRRSRDARPSEGSRSGAKATAGSAGSSGDATAANASASGKTTTGGAGGNGSASGGSGGERRETATATARR